MSANDLLNLLTELRKSDKMRDLSMALFHSQDNYNSTPESSEPALLSVMINKPNTLLTAVLIVTSIFYKQIGKKQQSH